MYGPHGPIFRANIVQPTEAETPSQKVVDEEPVAENDSPLTESADREIRNMKAMIAQQSRQLSSLTKTVTELAAELKALKGS